MPHYSDMLLYLRKRARLTQQELASKTGLSRSAIGMYETGKREPDLETFEVFADFFNVDMNTLTGGQKEEKPATPQGDELSERDIRLVNWFRSLPPEKQKAILISQDGPEDLV